MPFKDWDAICRELSTPESSDAEDEINVPMIQKRAPRVAKMVQGILGEDVGVAPAVHPFASPELNGTTEHLRAALRGSAAQRVQRAWRRVRAPERLTMSSQRGAALRVQRAWRNRRRPCCLA